MRVRAQFWNDPSMALVTAVEFCFSTPRIDMHRCVPSQTTATPSSAIFSWIVSAIYRQPLLQLQPAREHVDEPGNLAESNNSAVRDVPDIGGHLPKNGSRWCSQRL